MLADGSGVRDEVRMGFKNVDQLKFEVTNQRTLCSSVDKQLSSLLRRRRSELHLRSYLDSLGMQVQQPDQSRCGDVECSLCFLSWNVIVMCVHSKPQWHYMKA